MMSKGQKVAILVANGFIESEFIQMQKTMRELNVDMKIVSANQGLVNGWDGQGWGHNYAVDAQINTALGADYDVLVIPGGTRSHDKLKMTAHTKRFIGSMMMAQKPVMAIGDSVNLLSETEQLDGRTVTGPDELRQMATSNAAIWNEESVTIDDNLLTGVWSDDYATAMQDMIKDHINNGDDIKAAA